MNKTVSIYIQRFNCFIYARCLQAVYVSQFVFFYIRSLTIVILANVECSQRNILQYCTVLYNISYLWNRFVAKETTYFRFIAMSVFTYVNRLFGIKRKKAPLNSQRTIKLKSQFFIQSSNIHDILHVISSGSILQKKWKNLFEWRERELLRRERQAEVSYFHF